MSEPRFFTFAEVMDEISGDKWQGAWCSAGGIWMFVPHSASDDELKAAMNRLLARAAQRDGYTQSPPIHV